MNRIYLWLSVLFLVTSLGTGDTCTFLSDPNADLYSSTQYKLRQQDVIHICPQLSSMNRTWSINPNLPPGLVFQDGIISGSAATRTGMMDYVVTMEEIYPEKRTRNQTIQIEIYSLVCPAEDGWPETYDRSSVYRSCSLSFGRAIRTCTDGHWEEYSDCHYVWIFFLSSGGSILLLLMFFIVSLTCCCKKVKSVSSLPNNISSIEMTVHSSVEQGLHTEESSSSIELAVGTSQQPNESVNIEFDGRSYSDVSSPIETSDLETVTVNAPPTQEEIGDPSEVPAVPARTPPIIPPKPGLGVLMGLSESHYELPPPPPPKPSKLSLHKASSTSEGLDPVKSETLYDERTQQLNASESGSQSIRLPLPPTTWQRSQSKQDEEPMIPHRAPPPLQPEKPLRRAPSLPSSDIPHRPNRPAPSLTTEVELFQSPPSRLVTPPSLPQQTRSQSLHGIPPLKPEKPSKPAHLFQSGSTMENDGFISSDHLKMVFSDRHGTEGDHEDMCELSGYQNPIHIRYDSIISSLSSSQLMTEKEFLQRLSHANILKFIGYSNIGGRDCILEEFGGDSLEVFLAKGDVDDSFIIDTAMSILYGVRYVYNQSDLPYGSLDMKHIYVTQNKKVKLNLPEFRVSLQTAGWTVGADLSELSKVLTALAGYATKSNVQQVLRYCGQLCLSKRDKSVINDILENLATMQ